MSAYNLQVAGVRRMIAECIRRVMNIHLDYSGITRSSSQGCQA